MKYDIVKFNILSKIFFQVVKRTLYLVLDNSNFVTPEQFETYLMFVSSVVEKLYHTESRFAVLSFNDNPQLHITFGQRGDSRAQLKSWVRPTFDFKF